MLINQSLRFEKAENGFLIIFTADEVDKMLDGTLNHVNFVKKIWIAKTAKETQKLIADLTKELIKN